MERLTDLARDLNRSVPVLRAMQAKLGLPVLRGDRYPGQYVVFLRKVMALRRLGVGEDRLVRLFDLEKKLMVLLNADALGSETWFLDSVMQAGGGARRLLLTNFDVGCDLGARALQPGLDLRGRSRELFGAAEMGEDALRILRKYLAEYRAVIEAIKGELPLLHGALAWGKRLIGRRCVADDKKAPGQTRRHRHKMGGMGDLLPGMG
ncbi:MAG TPA: hypothetical protein PLU30_05425 [Verrucomicrobiae bacterium]|nr:hypothetical protein [Verrucomicrobiae bacterium]